MNEQTTASIQRFWQQIIEDDEMPVPNRMKASELLYRSIQSSPPQSEPVHEGMEVAKRIALAQEIIAKYSKKGGKG
jgi:hypothetical protein